MEEMSVIFVKRHKSPEVLEPADRSLHLPAMAVMPKANEDSGRVFNPELEEHFGAEDVVVV